MKILSLLEVRKNSTHPAQKRLTGLEPFDRYFGKDVENYYVSYTEIDKIGVNPKSNYQTPIGIYTYPMEFLKDIGKMNQVPFAGNSPNLFIITPTVPILVLNEYDNLDNDIAKLTEFLKQDSPYTEAVIVNTINSAVKTARYVENIAASRMWNCCRIIADRMSAYKENRSATVCFNYILRKVLGYSILRDDGMGLIHPSERTQCVFLDIKTFKVVEKIKNTKNNLNEKQANSLKRYKEFCNKMGFIAVELTADDYEEVINLDGLFQAKIAFRIPNPLDDNLDIEEYRISTAYDIEDELQFSLNRKLSFDKFISNYRRYIQRSMPKIIKTVSHPISIENMIVALVRKIKETGDYPQDNPNSDMTVLWQQRISRFELGSFLWKYFPKIRNNIVEELEAMVLLQREKYKRLNI